MQDSQRNELESFRASISTRFRFSAGTALFAQTVSRDPIKITRIASPPVTTERLAAEDAFVLHLHMSPLPSLDMWIDDVHKPMPGLRAGELVLLDLASAPFADIHDSMDFMLFQISRRTLDDLAYDAGLPRISGFRPILGGVLDPVLHGLSYALESRLNVYGSEDKLFVDYVGLALHQHIVQTYGEHSPFPNNGRLCPWQLRRACDMMTSDLSGKISVAELAEACCLSVSYFVRAFRNTMGMPPHKWMMEQRLKLAKKLLKERTLSLPEIALACGFSDQSHFTKAFSAREGTAPGRWRHIMNS